MKLPLTFTLLLPIIFVCSWLFRDDTTVVSVFIMVSTFLFLLEVRLKLGSLSRKNIIAFFNTPIKKEDGFGEEVVDDSPEFSLLTGSLIILVVGIFAIIAIAFIFSFT